MRILAWVILWPAVLAALVLGAAWWWAGSNDSLATVLARAARYLPEGQQLQASEVTGSLRHGGRIGQLRWESKGLAVTAEQLDVGWDVAVLLRSQLSLSHLKIGTLRIENTEGGPSEPFTPPQSLVLPIHVDIPFTIDTLHWAGPPALAASGLVGRYRYDGTQHAVAIDGVQVADGHYQAQATLLARAPLTLQATVNGTVQAAVPGSRERLPLAARVRVQGPLAGQDAVLQVQAQLGPAAGAAPRAANPMQARVQASVQPWAAQPLQRADARFAQINLASLWPDLPQTLLGGEVQLAPRGSGWQAEAKIDNAAAGPWDKQRAPVNSAQAQLRFQDGAWIIDSLLARTGPGELRGTGQWRQGTAASAMTWQADLDLRRINPALLHTRFAPAVLDGHAKASAAKDTISFDVDLQPSAAQAAGSPLQGLRLREVQAKGRWAAPLLNLSALKVRTDDALLQGQLELQATARSGRGDLRLTLPGGQASLRGQLAASQGAGDFVLDLADAGKAARWLAQWPGMPALLATSTVQGQARLAGRWQGGWNALEAVAPPSAAASPTGRGSPSVATSPAALQATLNVQRLTLRTADQAPTDALALRDLRAEVDGTLTALNLKLAGEVAQGPRRLQLDAQATGGRGAAAGEWQARLGSLTAQLQDSARPGSWRAQLRAPLALNLRQAGTSTRLEAAAGELQLTGPVPGTARIQWEPLRWQRNGNATELRTAGRILDLPMGWIDTVLAGSGTQLSNLPVAGNMVFEGGWNLTAADTLRLEASLQRKSGDLSMVNEDVAGGRIDAGVRQAEARLSTDGDKLSASLRWDSERAGEVQADFSTRVSRSNEGWRWADDAPLAGTLKARLPRVGAWAMLAPPGWRMRGTLEANASLGGTRQAPQYSGSVQADDLALRSVVEGIELRDGRLRASLRGQRLELTEFTLRGAPVANGAPTSGGMVTATGFAEWVPGSGLRSDVQARAQALRASLRADRRLVVSGDLRAQTEGPKLTVRGTLKADEALFILPEDSAPSLGSDVVVLSKAPAAGPAPAASTPATSTSTTPDARSTDIAVAFEMGDNFRVQGRGLSTRLTGALNITSAGRRAGALPSVTGELRTVQGTYRAYGQALDIEQGVLRFSGAYDNPALDVLAIRPNLTQRVGVQITGTALSPRIRLYADPELPDAEKLAWLVLGRSAANGGAESAVLQQAALALLGGSGGGITGGLAKTLGLDELSFSGAASNGSGTTTSATVTLGKRLSRNFYVAYERSLTGTLGSFFIFYDLSRRLTLRAQTGEKSALDLIFTVPYD